MIKLSQAKRTSKKLGRDGSEVTFSKIKVLKKDRYAQILNCTIVRGKTKGTGEYKCEITYSTDPNMCKVYCDCADFKYTFYHAINEVGGASKRINADELKSKGTGVVRHIDKPGLCKHLLALAKELKSTGETK